MSQSLLTKHEKAKHEMKQILKIKNYEVGVFLGCSSEEQSEKQPVRFTLEIKFLNNLAASLSDKINDAVDYVKLTEIIKKTSLQKKYHLIEHLNQQVFESVVVFLKNQNIAAEVSLTIHKMRVPIENLIDGVEFTCQQTLS